MQVLEIDEDAFSGSGEIDGFWCLILCRCWGLLPWGAQCQQQPLRQQQQRRRGCPEILSTVPARLIKI
jgi:hypothetical protein